MIDSKILEEIESFGVDQKRLSRALDFNDNWGGMVYAFEYLMVLGVVEDAMIRAAEESETK